MAQASGGRVRGLLLSNRRFVEAIAVIIALTIGAALVGSGDTSPTVGARVQPSPRAGAAGRLSGARQAGGAAYLVRPGDCLERIARRNAISVAGLAKANGIGPEATLIAGQHLTIPAAPKPQRAPTPEQRRYTVRRGDSLWLVAKRLGTTPKALAALNGMRSTARLRAGQRLRIAGEAKPQSKATAASTDDSLVETALRYRGVRYRYGGITTRGMDCSGLVYRVLNIHGIDAPHNSRALYRLGKPVARKNLRSGDLVFFNTRGRGISHVGIYIGDSKFVHASSGKGWVRVDRLDEGYYARRYVGARRVS